MSLFNFIMLRILTVTIAIFSTLIWAKPEVRLLQDNDENQNAILLAIVVLLADNGSNVSGNLVLFQLPSNRGLLIKGTVNGLAPNTQHGFHVHQFGDLTNKCASVGDHYNPFGRFHGGPMDFIKHVGDLGNITANANGTANVRIVTNAFSLNNRFPVLGRSLVVHANVDDLGRGTAQTSKTTGNSGARVGCGVISIANPAITPVPSET